MTADQVARDPCVWTDDMGEISGIGAENPGYEQDMRRMLMAGAEWLRDRPDAEIAITKALPHRQMVVIAAWERVFSGDSPHGHELLAVLHRACCADRGDARGPTALQMAHVIEHLRMIERMGWEAYAALRRKARKEGVV
jgi:hypothetical protein